MANWGRKRGDKYSDLSLHHFHITCQWLPLAKSHRKPGARISSQCNLTRQPPSIQRWMEKDRRGSGKSQVKCMKSRWLPNAAMLSIMPKTNKQNSSNILAFFHICIASLKLCVFRLTMYQSLLRVLGCKHKHSD